MKRLKNLFTIILVLFALVSFGQSPEHISYQAVLRNTITGTELQNQPVYLVVKFLEGSQAGDIVYQEEHANVQTNTFGLINIQLGEGTPVVGNFTDIPWQSGHIWLSLEVDSGDGLQPVGSTEFSSVPYALFAASANSEPDGDGDSTNEIQDLSLSENTLTITNNPSAAEIDLSRFVNPEPDGDGDSTNEIQDLSFSGNKLKITNNASAMEIDLGSFENPSLAPGKIFIGDASNVATPRSISGDISINATGATTVKGIQSTPVATTAPNDGDVLVYDQTAGKWVPKTISDATAVTKYYSVDPMDFVELTDPENGIDLDKHKAIKYYNDEAPFAMIYKSEINTIGAPVHLPDGVVITKVKFYLKNSYTNKSFTFRLSRKAITDYSTTNEVISSGTAYGHSGNSTYQFTPTLMTDIDNSQFVYRIFVNIKDDEEDKDESIENIQQVIYGAVIEYH